ncbi:hypothetical protein BDR26DRAFT_585076 [Obelidium mucronatum]|nr:hypothetical protein BDR26DRAFT_585076 [Obelidium mucronatum]
MSTNSTLLAPTPAVSTQDFAVMGILAGLTMEISFSGIISTAVRVFSGDASMGPGGFLPIAIIMSLFNSWSIIYNSLFVWTFFLNPTNCAVGQRATNVSSHFFYVTFGTLKFSLLPYIFE